MPKQERGPAKRPGKRRADDLGPATEAKPLVFVASARRDLRKMPAAVRSVFGFALSDVQHGNTPAGARAFGEGLPHEIMKLSEDYDTDTYRAVYTVEFPLAVYVLDVFKKKSTGGRATPEPIKRRVRARFREAREHYKEHYDADFKL